MHNSDINLVGGREGKKMRKKTESETICQN